MKEVELPITQEEYEALEILADNIRERLLAHILPHAPAGSELAVCNGILLGAHAVVSAVIETINGMK